MFDRGFKKSNVCAIMVSGVIWMAGLKIIHVDMDAFFAAIEIRDNPELVGKPVIIGASNPQQRGVVSTASYEARKFGVRSAMPLVEAYRRCPDGIFLDGNMKKYETVSRDLMIVLSSFTPLVEPLSLDEAFLDISGCERLFGSPEEIAKKIKREIRRELGLVASLGVAPNKFLAKLASDLEKPDGLVIITPDRIREVLDNLPVERLWGVGEKTESILKERGINYIGQVARMEMKFLEGQLGSTGRLLWHLAQGIDDRPVEPLHEVKSVGREHTFLKDIQDHEYLVAVLCSLAEDVGRRLRKIGLGGRVITLKLRFKNFKTITRRKTLAEKTCWGTDIFKAGKEILREQDLKGSYIRLIGISVSGLGKIKSNQPKLFSSEKRKKEEQMVATLDKLKNKFGESIIGPARLLELEKDK